ncbi:MAG: hypothetical protein GX357_10590 [Firmicutes bacterium]|nr:hypothetical protein [Bacillota bacterium]
MITFKLVSIETVKEIACSNNDFNLVELKDEINYLLSSLDDVHQNGINIQNEF